MAQSMQVTDTLSIVPLVAIQSVDFHTWYRIGVWWRLRGYEGSGLLEDKFFPNLFLQQIEKHAYPAENNTNLIRDVAFCLGKMHGGVVLVDGVLCEDVVTLVQLQESDIIRGYNAGRNFFFLDATSEEEWTMTEDYLLTWLRELIEEYEDYENGPSLIRFHLGSILGQLSGLLFPWTSQEQQAFETESLDLLGFVSKLHPNCLLAQQNRLKVAS